MPVATKRTGTDRKELKSLPEAYVVLQRMSYGESVERRAMMKLSFDASPNQKDFKGEMAMASVDVQWLEYRACIVEHNLQDESGRTLDFRNINDMKILDPQVGQEIEQYISEMNDFNDSAEANLTPDASPSFSKDDEAIPLPNSA